jgi:large subunit ribosomal protein L22
MPVKYTHNPKPEKSVRVYGRGIAVSTKYSVLVCRKITGMSLGRAKSLLAGLASERLDLDGKHYTTISKEMLSLLNNAESNAEFKGLDPSKLTIHASAHKAFSYFRPRGMKRRREKRKMTNIQLVLEQR